MLGGASSERAGVAAGLTRPMSRRAPLPSSGPGPIAPPALVEAGRPKGTPLGPLPAVVAPPPRVATLPSMSAQSVGAKVEDAHAGAKEG